MFSRSRCVVFIVIVAVPRLLRSAAKTRLLLLRSRRAKRNHSSLLLSLSLPLPLFPPFRLSHHNSACAAATLRPAARPFLLAGVFKGGEEGAEEAAARAGAGASGASNPTCSTSDPVDGVAAAAAAVLSLAPGATLGSVSDAAVTNSALWPVGGGGSGGGGGGEQRESENGDENGDAAAADELNEWLARHTVDFLDAAALLHGALSSQYCTPQSCPAMRAGPRHEYLWAEPEIPGGRGGGEGGERSGGTAAPAAAPTSPAAAAAAAAAAPPRKRKPQKPSRLAARDYAAALFSWADVLLASPHAFPQAKGEPFPRGFRAHVLQPLYRRLARVFAHCYFAHWREIGDPRILNASAHLTTVFKHYVAFGREHGLLPEGELDPVRTLVEALLPSSKRREEAEEDAEQAPLPPSSSRATAAGKGGKGARVEVSASSAAVS